MRSPFLLSLRIATYSAIPLCAALSVAIPSVAHAQSSDDASTKAARSRFLEGVQFYQKGQYESARASFLQAYALRKHPAILLNLGQSSLRSGHHADASRYFNQFLRESTSLTDDQRNDAEKGLAEARQKLGRFVISAPTASDITVDGINVGVTPLSEAIDVEPGSHVVRCKMSDGVVDSRTVSVTAGEKLPVSFAVQLVPNTTSRPVETPPPVVTPPVTTTVVTPPPNDDVSPPPPSESKPGIFSKPKSMTPVWIGGGVAVVGFGTAIFFAAQKSSAQSSVTSVETSIRGAGGVKGICNSTATADVTKFGSACTQLKSNLDAVDQDALFGNLALGLGIAGGAFALGWYLFSSKEETASAQAKRPTITPMFGEVRGFQVSFAY